MRAHRLYRRIAAGETLSTVSHPTMNSLMTRAVLVFSSSLRQALLRQAPLCLLLLVAAAVIARPSLAQQNLPQMGEPADNALSPQQEKLMGQEFMRQIRAQLPLIRDTLSNEYLSNLGHRLASSAKNRDISEFSFFIVADQSINAFAIPGGYIGVYAGLAQAMQREDQLAGVVAHEIAHVTQRHHARAFATAGKNRMSTAAAILAAIVIGASNPEAGQAALAAGLAISQQTALNYTRAHEYEADRIGIRILSDADLDPSALAETFEILRRRNSLNTSGYQIEYLRTHPLDSNRIAEARSRAAGLQQPDTETRQLDFLLFRARLAVLSSRDDARLQRRLQTEFARGKNHDAAYALALLAARNDNFKQAEQYLQGALQAHPDNIFISLLQASLLFDQGQISKSTDIHEQLLSVYPGRYPIVEQFANQLISQRKLKKAAAVIRRYQRATASPSTQAWRELANIQERLGQLADSHESLANYFLELNELVRARQQLELALRRTDRGSNDELRLSAQLRDIKKKQRH